ncbi:MAG: valine--tRNA ligase, partial [Patescibacteria group bacterium]
ATLWLPGADHAGLETQYVFEKHLVKNDQSRFDFDRETLYKMIWEFVQNNRGNMEEQLKRLGFSLDWSREKFTLDEDIVAFVHQTFKKLYDDGLIYRGERLVNFCTKCGTSFSDLEVKYVEQKDPLYYIRYENLTAATARPETMFGDTCLAVHPEDKRYKHLIGKTIAGLPVVGDTAVDPKFGTGVVKVTPAHDPVDYEIGKRHNNLPAKQVIGFDGRMTEAAGKYAGLKIKLCREQWVEELKNSGRIEKIDNEYTHNVATCYKCGTVLEPLPKPQWFVKIKPLADHAIKAINKGETKFVPVRFKKIALQWLKNFHDWNISRQIVWGIRIPAWQCKSCNNNETRVPWIITDGTKPQECPVCHGTALEQDPDTFDTWFSSGQWPVATLKSKTEDFNYFYPTSVMETGYDILPWWVCRMMMLGIYLTGKVPFKTVYLHGMVRDAKGQKMSKSKGNVIDPMDMVEKYGADALRFSLVYGMAAGTDLSMSEDKIRGMRNFCNKLWNIARFVETNREIKNQKSKIKNTLNTEDKDILDKTQTLVNSVTKDLENYRFGQAAEKLYDFIWHELADKEIENCKVKPERLSTLCSVYLACLQLLSPFMPFITSEIKEILTNRHTL